MPDVCDREGEVEFAIAQARFGTLVERWRLGDADVALLLGSACWRGAERPDLDMSARRRLRRALRIDASIRFLIGDDRLVAVWLNAPSAGLMHRSPMNVLLGVANAPADLMADALDREVEMCARR